MTITELHELAYKYWQQYPDDQEMRKLVVLLEKLENYQKGGLPAINLPPMVQVRLFAVQLPKLAKVSQEPLSINDLEMPPLRRSEKPLEVPKLSGFQVHLVQDKVPEIPSQAPQNPIDLSDLPMASIKVRSGLKTPKLPTAELDLSLPKPKVAKKRKTWAGKARTVDLSVPDNAMGYWIRGINPDIKAHLHTNKLESYEKRTERTRKSLVQKMVYGKLEHIQTKTVILDEGFDQVADGFGRYLWKSDGLDGGRTQAQKEALRDWAGVDSDTLAGICRRIVIAAGDDPWDIADAFRAMVDAVTQYIKEAWEKYHEEATTARMQDLGMEGRTEI